MPECWVQVVECRLLLEIRSNYGCSVHQDSSRDYYLTIRDHLEYEQAIIERIQNRSISVNWLVCFG